jgi:hypothetical protein
MFHKMMLKDDLTEPEKRWGKINIQTREVES